MTIQDYGSIGEVVGAIATVLTFGYLAVQIRSAKNLMRRESWRSTTEQSSRITLLLAQDQQLSDIFGRGIADPASLNRAERTQLMFLLGEIFSSVESHFFEFREGMIDPVAFDSVIESWLGIFMSPAGREHWSRLPSGHPEFIAFMNREVFEGSTEKQSPTRDDAAQQGAAADSA